MRAVFFALALLPLASGCSLALDLDQFLGADAGGRSDAGTRDAGPSDAGPSDAGDEDAATRGDAGFLDAGMEPCFGSTDTRCLAQMAAGAQFTCARLADGQVLCWGSNSHGQLGYDDVTEDRTSRPGVPVDGLMDAIDLSAAHKRACAVREEDGQILCWGEHTGDSTAGERLPEHVEGIRDAVQVSVGQAHACARLSDGDVYCWGRNNEGQLGTDSSASLAEPARVHLPGPAAQVSAGLMHTCARLESGKVYCWGTDTEGRVTGQTGVNGGLQPAPVEVEIDGAMDISAGSFHTCAVFLHGDGDGRVACWGANGNGQLGTPDSPLPATPVTVTGLFRVVEVTVGDAHTCARTEDGSVACWGKNDAGQLGNESNAGSTRVWVEMLTGAASLTTGARHNCVVVESGGRCWGANYDGQLGNGTWENSAEPVAVMNL